MNVQYMPRWNQSQYSETMAVVVMVLGAVYLCTDAGWQLSRGGYESIDEYTEIT